MSALGRKRTLMGYNDLASVVDSKTGENNYQLTVDASAFSPPDKTAKFVFYIADGAGETQATTSNTSRSSVSFVNVAEGNGKGTITAQDANGNILGKPFTFLFDMAPYETDDGTLIVSLAQTEETLHGLRG